MDKTKWKGKCGLGLWRATRNFICTCEKQKVECNYHFFYNPIFSTLTHSRIQKSNNPTPCPQHNQAYDGEDSKALEVHLLCKGNAVRNTHTLCAACGYVICEMTAKSLHWQFPFHEATPCRHKLRPDTSMACAYCNDVFHQQCVQAIYQCDWCFIMACGKCYAPRLGTEWVHPTLCVSCESTKAYCPGCYECTHQMKYNPDFDFPRCYTDTLSSPSFWVWDTVIPPWLFLKT